MGSYRADIDGLRALSIGLVVAYHAGVDLFAGGYVGVDVFFVISGYLITSLLITEIERTGTVSLRQFVARRARRLLPLAALVLTFTAVIGSWLVAPLQRPRLFDDVTAAALFVANWRFAAQAVEYQEVTASDSLVNHWWSLAVEEQFYVAWPLLVLAVSVAAVRWLRTPVRTALTMVTAAVLAMSFTFSVVLTARVGTEAYYLTHARLWELSAGALLAAVIVRNDGRQRRVPSSVAQVLSVGGLTAIVVSSVAFDASTPFPGIAAALPVVGTVALITAGVGNTTRASAVLSHSALTQIGKWSYAWYLWHWPVIGLALLASDRWAWTYGTATVTGGAVALSLVLAAMSHHLVENPVRRAHWLAERPRRSVTTGLVAVAMPVVAVTLMGGWMTSGGESVQLAVGVTAMTPEEAAADTVALDRSDNCNATIVQDTPGSDCVFGDQGGTLDFVLVGDSHAQHWLPALHQVGQERSWRVHAFTKSACPAFDLPQWNTRLNRRYRECEVWHERVREHISALPGAVVILANTHGYGTLTLDERGGRIDDPERFAEVWTAATKANAERLLDTASMVIRLHDTPWSPRNVPDCLSMHPDEPSRCDFELEGRAKRDQMLLDAEASAVSQYGLSARYRFVNPAPLVCPDDPCRVVDERGVVVYRDQHHLTQTYVRSIASMLGDLIMEAVDGG